MSLYEDFLNYSRPKIDDYFKNISLFDNQFKFTNFNEECLQQMFIENTQNSIKTVKELKESISELKPTCKACGNYYMQPRNSSRKKLDVQLGRFLEDLLIEFFNDKLKIKAMHGDNSNKKYPDCMVLGTDKGILAYFEVKYHNAPFLTAINKIGRYCYEGSATLDLKKVITQIELIESDLDRPVFYLHWIDYPCLKGIFFETSEQVKENIRNINKSFERAEREGDFVNTKDGKKKVGYTKKIYSNLLEMGTFEEFVDILLDMKKNGVKTY
ncbi:hypothetical protein [Clostridium perfringens]|uniref:hypothetical protein n=1 Tax=Clostridium perfringens TaxID=1502 RepID=UPI000E17FD13|nr:hypothetical protein [Clostridium perfringens]SUY37513.1 Uncharacterised protein [Clostridium perfringens]